MSASLACETPRDGGYFNACQICGVPGDAGYFDVASFQSAPATAGDEVELARYALHSQYCGALLSFVQFAEEETPPRQVISQTPGYEWTILCNNQPLSPYLPTTLILNPWGYNAFSVHLRLAEGCVVRLVVRKVTPLAGPGVTLSQVGGRLIGRTWYNANYGGAPNRL
ncbi:MAG: hypothetical protein ABI831_12400 [Betaproteobacteria bacterium]